ncbi:ribosome biogenesis protein [Perkinsela sp. CCAP 1560/4]|nr:ribosome biogenesis protein [Perkinsela sp. CCAP 1560/4]|eukprot:KNH05435.1 ribosome biogenesis protein [Perkinsela sp. CCAP 1560/4]
MKQKNSQKSKSRGESTDKASLERSDRAIRSQKNRIARSDAHHRRRAKKQEIRKQARGEKRRIERKTGEKLPTPPMKDMEEPHREQVLIERMLSSGIETVAGSAQETVETPKVLLTTCKKPIFVVNAFMKDLRKLIPNAKFYTRRDYPLVDICVYARSANFTHVVSVTQAHGKVVGMIVTALSQGFTAHFRLSNLMLCKDVPRRAEWTKHYPELFFKNFEASIGDRTKGILESLFPRGRDYRGRAVVTFLNKRDFIFVRAHRYIFGSLGEVSIQELGPRFTLRMQKLTERSFDDADDISAARRGDVVWSLSKEKSKRDLVL